MKAENAIEVRDLRKKFKVYYDKGRSLQEKIMFKNRNYYEERWVLKGISFDIKKGEAVGLIGHNGCGKSTTLKLLAGILYPDGGSVELAGRVSSLLELGAGFHPDMSGRENIYINASIFGLSKKEIDKRLDEIIEFSELEQFIDNPVRTYSSGMYMRLAFSVAINVNADILLIDEILAVGDVNFQTKCFNKLMEIRSKGTTIVLVSHSPDQIERICSRSIWVQDGEIRMEGNARKVHKAYLEFMNEERKKIEEKEKKESLSAEQKKEEIVDDIKRRGTGEARILSVRCTNSKGQDEHFFLKGDTVKFEITYKVNKKVPKAYFGLCILRNDGVRCYGNNTRGEGLAYKELNEDGKVTICFPKMQLMKGEFIVDVTIEDQMGNTLDYYDSAASFDVSINESGSGVTYLEHTWELE